MSGAALEEMSGMCRFSLYCNDLTLSLHPYNPSSFSLPGKQMVCVACIETMYRLHQNKRRLCCCNRLLVHQVIRHAYMTLPARLTLQNDFSMVCTLMSSMACMLTRMFYTIHLSLKTLACSTRDSTNLQYPPHTICVTKNCQLQSMQVASKNTSHLRRLQSCHFW